MSEIMQLNIIAGAETSDSVDISELYIPAYYGQAGILENHLPYITVLGAGEVSYKDTEGKKHYIFVNGGFLENHNNKIFLLADELERGEDLDKEDIEEKLVEVDKIIKSSLKGEISPEELQERIGEQKALRSKKEIIAKLGK